MQRWGIDYVVTFDGSGVSGHPNHIAIWSALGSFRDVPVYQLESTNILRKYIGLLDAYWSVRTDLIAVNVNSKLCWDAMNTHYSQFVWYRKLFVVFSRYAYLNTFVKLN